MCKNTMSLEKRQTSKVLYYTPFKTNPYTGRIQLLQMVVVKINIHIYLVYHPFEGELKSIGR